MMRFTVLAVGKLKDPRLVELCDEYIHRLHRHATVKVEEIRDATRASTAEGMVREAQDIRARLRPSTTTVALASEGRSFTSEALASWLAEHANQGRSDLSFIIGGPNGLASELLTWAHHRLSLSSLTFTHELARLILLEQLYRAMSIWHNEPYHRGG